MDVFECVHCGGRVVLKADGACPACGKSNSDAPSFAAPLAPSGPEAAKVDNPYQSTSTAGPQRGPTGPQDGKNAKQPFSYQAARFSCYAPLALFLMNAVVQAALGRQQDFWVSVTIAVISVMLVLAGLVLGVVGLIGGIIRPRVGTIVYAVIGLILNSGVIAMCVWLFISLRQIRQGP